MNEGALDAFLKEFHRLPLQNRFTRFFYVLLTVHLSIILVINQLNVQIIVL